jgi:hypothetical protein
MDLTSTDLKQLVGFQFNLVHAERHFANYDLRQIFMIVDPDGDSNGNKFQLISQELYNTASFSGTQSLNSRKCLPVITGGTSTQKTTGLMKTWASRTST